MEKDSAFHLHSLRCSIHERSDMEQLYSSGPLREEGAITDQVMAVTCVKNHCNWLHPAGQQSHGHPDFVVTLF